MLKPGIFSMQDFHFFRQYEFDKCVKSLQIPCRWAPDAGLGYGEPIFNYYGQFSYAIGEVFHLIGFNIIDSVKILFILSLLGSGLAMFFLAKRIWNDDFAAFISSVVYVYAPYRAVDVWVRGALPEAFSFLLFPLIILFIDKFIFQRRVWHLLMFSLLTAILIITHNLSFVMFLPFLLIWITYRLYVSKSWKLSLKIIFGFIVSALFSAFYLLPVALESKFVDLGSTITGYFDYRAHFVTLYQIFISRFWGYGGSTWGPNDGLSLSVGQLQWVLALLVLVLIFIKRKISANMDFLIIFMTAIFYLFLTHNKSTFIWNLIPGMAYIQFPWRFLGMATFLFALSGGVIVQFLGKYKVFITILIVVSALALNFSFFREDIWYAVGDSYFTTGAEWVRQRTASIGDYWPNFGHKIPDSPSDGRFINYFPGWIGAVPDKNGLIPSRGTSFTDTPVRRAGNIISLISVFGLMLIYVMKIKWIEKA